jgi:hypothetical protein
MQKMKPKRHTRLSHGADWPKIVPQTNATKTLAEIEPAKAQNQKLVPPTLFLIFQATTRISVDQSHNQIRLTHGEVLKEVRITQTVIWRNPNKVSCWVKEFSGSLNYQN